MSQPPDGPAGRRRASRGASRRASRRAVLRSAAAAGALVGVPGAVGAAPGDSTESTGRTESTAAALPGGKNDWLDRRVLNVAHQGGALEAPSNTLFAFETARATGADVLELDVHATADGELVVVHDVTVDRTTDGSGRVDELTLAEVKALDAAYWFVEGCGACHDEPPGQYDYRGYATGDRPIPPGLAEQHGIDSVEPNDFRIPTLREVLERFPDALLNVEIKRTAPQTESYEEELAALLAEYGRSDDVLVVSFYDRAMEAFKAHAPAVDTAMATGQTAAFYGSGRGPLPGAPNPRYEALQVPTHYEGVEVVTEGFVADAHENDLAVHVWTIDDPAEMRRLVELDVDGVMTDRPTVLADVLADLGVGYD